MSRVPTIDDLRAELAALLRTDPAEIADDDNLLDHGLDSMRLMQLVERWKAQGLVVPFAALAERPELAHWDRLLREHAADGADA